MISSGGQLCRVGVLAIQGAFAEHKKMLVKAATSLGQEASVVVVEVRRSDQLTGLAGLIIPGGESTTMSLFLNQNGLGSILKSWIESGLGKGVVWGTCAGLILLSNKLKEQKSGGQALVSDLSFYKNALLLHTDWRVGCYNISQLVWTTSEQF